MNDPLTGQYVAYTFFKVDPAWRRLPVEERAAHKEAFAEVIADFEPHSQAVFFKVLVKPLVNLIWLAGLLFVFGSLVTLWPDAREQRRLVTRLALARA